MPPTSRKRAAPRKSAPPPPFPQLYDGPLPTPNVFARMYLYEWLVHFDDPNALGWPLHCLDALHCWDTAIAYAFLHRLALRLSGLATLGSGQPAARTSRLIDVLRKHKHNPEAYAPWKVAESMLGDHVPPLSLSEVDMDIPVLSSRTPGVKRAATPELPVPRRTRSAARLEAAFTSISESEPELEVAQDGTRRSRRAEQLAAKKRHDDLRMQAEKMLGARTAQEEVQDEQGSMHLETKFACLARLCTLLCTTPAPKDSVPGATILHRQVQPLLDAFSDTERAAREYTAEVEETCDAEMRAFQRRGPSMISPKYASWKQERSVLSVEHAHRITEAQARQYIAERLGSARSGPLGRDARGNVYWHLCPLDTPLREEDAVALGFFSGHWTDALLVSSDTDPHAPLLGTTDPSQVHALATYLEHQATQGNAQASALAALAARLLQVEAYLTTKRRGDSSGTQAPP